ncbi:DUF3105 domain-containing protein (plasmid) [Rhodococcus pseudokoreensis]|uniref:DUF3105 domain-containing protein n=1 Tax=Rhodococcus pseudokoreensis TaxID=2811421 RepID=A0A974VYU3_9NOCA|nr:DUF3105 domain-containing protein [Rhodococcus pseudokoreensis]QSE87694.1 DUF3105 domain-containing protein [Rhodococcus pseudokoreensis]
MTNNGGKGTTSRPTPGGVPGTRRFPWLMIGAAVIVVGLIAVIAYALVPQAQEKGAAQGFSPSADNPDPSTGIDGVVKIEYPAGNHVQAPQRVAYDQSPPFGGAHDQYWATCTGIVYPDAIRTENAVHSLEHGAVWVTYNPDRLSSDDIAALASNVDGKTYTLMSPYPGLDSAVSLQSWGHQLKLDDVHDPRIPEFITALRQNPNTYPEPGASCSTVQGGFDPANPPPFDPSAPGPDAVPVNGK